MDLALFPELSPQRQGLLAVGGGHRIYWEESGAADGTPVLVLHGGPGGHSAPWVRRLFDPRHYRIIQFDQRGCGHSQPYASVAHNTTWHLIDDIERLRTMLGVERWLLFGGSWGSTLALLYAQAMPDRVEGLVLRGVFTATAGELAWFYRDGTRHYFPEAWSAFVAPLAPHERDDPAPAWRRRLFHGSRAQQLEAARCWTAWEMATSRLRPEPQALRFSDAFARAFARIEAHYFAHDCWLLPDQIANHMASIAALPGWIVQGRYDAICPPSTAWRLHQRWPASTLHMVDDAGHSALEPGILRALVAAVAVGGPMAPRPGVTLPDGSG